MKNKIWWYEGFQNGIKKITKIKSNVTTKFTARTFLGLVSTVRVIPDQSQPSTITSWR